MNTSSSSPQMILGTTTSSSTFVHKSLGLTSLEMTVDAFAIKIPDTSSSEILYIDMGLRPSLGDVLPSTKPTESLMFSTVALVVVTSWVCPPPKKSFEKDTCGPLCFMTASMLSRNVINSNFMQTNHKLHHLLYTQSSWLTPFANGESIS
jgi:hypothetical protein